MTQEEAEKIAADYMELAERVVRWFGFDARKSILWGEHFNGAARQIYEEACRLTGRTPLPMDQPK